MRRPKIKNAIVASPVIPVIDTDITNSMAMNLDNYLAHSIINNILNDILDNLDTTPTPTSLTTHIK